MGFFIYGLFNSSQANCGGLYLATCFLRSAQRFFIASAIRLRPSGLNLRLLFAATGAAAFTVTFVAAFVGRFLLPLGRPRREGALIAALTPVSARSARACCNFDICESISAMMRLTSTYCLHSVCVPARHARFAGQHDYSLGQYRSSPQFAISADLWVSTKYPSYDELRMAHLRTHRC